MDNRNNKIFEYDETIYGLRKFCEHGHTDSYTMQKICSMVREEIEKLTAERNNLIRLGGIR